MLPVDTLTCVFLLFKLKNMPNKELLQVLIGIVDAQLFKTDKEKKVNYVTENIL
jgi:hypothetical protein